METTIAVIIFIFALLIAFQIKHFIADYILQGGFMLKKFLPDWGFFFPLVAHCSVHAVITFAIVFMIRPELWWLALVDFGIHFVMDRIKAGPRYLGRFKALSGNEYKDLMKANLSEKGDAIRKKRLQANTFFWWSLGFDQMVHHLTHYYIIWLILFL